MFISTSPGNVNQQSDVRQHVDVFRMKLYRFFLKKENADLEKCLFFFGNNALLSVLETKILKQERSTKSLCWLLRLYVPPHSLTALSLLEKHI